MLDVDFFKAINDQHGHLAGDHVLIETVRNVVKATRNSDVVFRYGGEEFVVVLSNTGPEGAERLAKRICAAVSDGVVKPADLPIKVTVSIGVAAWEQGDAMASLLERADHRLYEAKTTGRNRVVSC
jgi:diguanylate cyclase (GGDEF)-like protein